MYTSEYATPPHKTHITLHTSHTSSARDTFGPHRIKTRLHTHCMQNINCCQLALEVAHYYRTVIPQHCNFMLVKFMYF